MVSHYPNMSNICDTGISLRENLLVLRLASELVTSFACVSPSGETEPMRASHAAPFRRIIKRSLTRKFGFRLLLVSLYGSLVLVSGESVQLVDQNVVPLPLSAVLHHALEIGAHIVGARHSAVDVGFHDEDPVSLGIIVTNAKLTFDGLLGLVIAGIPSVMTAVFMLLFPPFLWILWFGFVGDKVHECG